MIYELQNKNEPWIFEYFEKLKDKTEEKKREEKKKKKETRGIIFARMDLVWRDPMKHMERKDIWWSESVTVLVVVTALVKVVVVVIVITM